MIYFNRKISTDRPVESQLKEIFQQIKSGEFFKEIRSSWKSLEEFLTKLLRSKPQEAEVFQH